MSKYRVCFGEGDLAVCWSASNKDEVIAILLQEVADASDKAASVRYPDGYVDRRTAQ